jgi:dTDP-glucose 4,6-dehydratase
MKLLVTGCNGFIGTNFVKYMLQLHPDWTITNLDALTYAGNRENLLQEEQLPNYHFVHGDIGSAMHVQQAHDCMGGVDAIVNFAAESHVDNSIRNPGVFVQTNVQGTVNLLAFAKEWKCRFVQVSTDEVYGSLGETGLFTEQTPLASNSPYSSSKAAADLMVRAWVETYGLDAVITRCSNNYGPYQFPEKLIPLAVTNVIDGQKIPVYGKGINIRDWLHVDDHCSGIALALEKGKTGEVYNIGGFNEWRNIDIVKEILSILNKDEDMLEFVPDRLGHDLRYAIDSSKITKELGWQPKYDFISGLPATVEWYLQNEKWWRPLKERIQKNKS